MCRACSMHGGDKKHTHNFGEEKRKPLARPRNRSIIVKWVKLWNGLFRLRIGRAGRLL
jgi:hypothetical protein